MYAQVNPHAIGLRFGGNGDVNGAEISYQHGMGDANRLELDLGWSGNNDQGRMSLAGIYHWDWNITDSFNWYVGPGATLGYHDHKNENDHFNVGVGGQIGIEYDFSANVPLLLSLDARPMWNLLGNDSGLGGGLALGLRYIW